MSKLDEDMVGSSGRGTSTRATGRRETFDFGLLAAGQVRGRTHEQRSPVPHRGVRPHQLCLLGLIGVERFDPSRQIKFETYAISRIKGSIIDELRSLDWVPRSVRSKAREIEKACALLENRLRRAPTDNEIAAELQVSPREFQQSLTQIANTSIVALDELWSISGSDGDQAALIDTLEDPKSKDPSRMLDLSEMKARLAAAIDALPKREKTVIALYYYENLTLREIGEVLGVTESRVSQLHTKAILRLKGRLRDEVEPAAIG
jgi:RNA polymerase sigma factor for flagellar operon FliA